MRKGSSKDEEEWRVGIKGGCEKEEEEVGE